MDLYSIILATFVVLLFYICWMHLLNTDEKLPPGKRGLPFIGNWELVQRNPRTWRDMGDIITLRLFGKKFIVINDWKLYKDALLGQADIFAGRTRLHVLNQLYQQRDIISCDGPLWKEKRSFALQALRDLGFGKSKVENIILNEMSKVFQHFDKNNGKPMEISGLFFMPTTNISWGLITGKTYEYDNDEMKRLSHMVQSRINLVCETFPINSIPLLRFLPRDPFGYCKLMRLSGEMRKSMNAELDEHVATFQPQNKPRDYIDAFLAEMVKRNISFDDVDDNKMEKETAPYNKSHLLGTMTNFLMTGMDTIRTTLEWALLYMSVWPEIQRKVQLESDTVLGRDKLPNYEDAQRLPYTVATLMEIHRYSCVIPFGGPYRTMGDTKLASYSIKKNTSIFTSLWAVHFNEELWGDPHIFRPERFLDADGKVVKPEFWIPFSIGPRSCPGQPLTHMQMFLFFAGLMQRYSFNCITGEITPSLVPSTTMSLTATPRPFRLTLHIR